MKRDDTLFIIVIDDSSNDAETVSNMLRNAGHAVRADRVEDDEDLREALGSNDWDMILAKPTIPYLTALDAISIVHNMHKDVPVIVLTDDANDSAIIDLLKSGARDTVSINQPARLVHVALRESRDRRDRAAHSACRTLLAEADARAQSLVDTSRDAITYVHDGMHIYTNESYLQMFGYSDPGEIEGMPVMNLVDSAEHGKFKTFLRDQGKGKGKGKDGDGQIEVNAIKADGSKFKITMEFTGATFEGEPCTQIVIRDQSLSKELEQKLDSMAKKDLLTSLYNRQYLFDHLAALVGKKGQEGALLFIDIANYKDVRDEVGIGIADGALAQVAAQVNKLFDADNEMVARFEGSIFAAVIKGANAEAAETKAKQLVSKIADMAMVVQGQTIGASANVGIGLYNEGLPGSQEVINRAEKALAEISIGDAGKVRVYSPGATEMADLEKATMWSKRLRVALKENQFRLLFQPIVSLRGDAMENYEVVMRMLDENGEDIPPGEFLPAAERAGLILAIDRWVIAHAAKRLIEHRRAGHKCNFFVKLSAPTIKDAKFLPWLRDLLKALHMPAGALIIEVAESVASTNLKPLKLLLEGLNQLHVRLALDHFGMAANYENLLKNCDAHYLKLDGEIIKGLTNNPEAQQKIGEITSVAKTQNKLTIANNIEDPATMAAIWSTGIDYIQGYFLQPPNAELDFDFSSMG